VRVHEVAAEKTLTIIAREKIVLSMEVNNNIVLHWSIYTFPNYHLNHFRSTIAVYTVS